MNAMMLLKAMSEIAPEDIEAAMQSVSADVHKAAAMTAETAAQPEAGSVIRQTRVQKTASGGKFLRYSGWIAAAACLLPVLGIALLFGMNRSGWMQAASSSSEQIMEITATKTESETTAAVTTAVSALQTKQTVSGTTAAKPETDTEPAAGTDSTAQTGADTENVRTEAHTTAQTASLHTDVPETSHVSEKASVTITFQIPAKVNGLYHISIYEDEILRTVGDDFEAAQVLGKINVAVEGRGEANLTAVLCNLENSMETTIGLYHVDFDKQTCEKRRENIAAAFAAVGEMYEYALYTVAENFDRADIPLENVWLSNAYTVVQQTERTVQYDYIVLNDDKVIGLLYVSVINNAYHSGFSYADFPDLQRACDDHAEIALFTNDAKLYMYDQASDIVYVLSRSDIEPEAAPEWLDTEALYIAPITPTYPVPEVQE
ncbi:MAG: hypothetical protein IJM46_13630 [Oscillospiraceae bacterium]|nr:hypothetical protein [Oscillospiraceae bacterium]